MRNITPVLFSQAKGYLTKRTRCERGVTLALGILFLTLVGLSLITTYKMAVAPSLDRAKEDTMLLPNMKKAAGMHPSVHACTDGKPIQNPPANLYPDELKEVYDWVMERGNNPGYLDLCLVMVEPQLIDAANDIWNYQQLAAPNASNNTTYGCSAVSNAAIAHAEAQATNVILEMRHNYFVIGVMYYSKVYSDAGINITAGMIGDPVLDKDAVFVSPACE